MAWPVMQGAVEAVSDTMEEPEGPVYAHAASADTGACFLTSHFKSSELPTHSFRRGASFF